MRRSTLLLIGAAAALTSAWAVAQDAPESLLPPVFDQPAPARQPAASPNRTPAPASTPSPRPASSGAAPAAATPVVQPLPAGAEGEPVPPVLAGAKLPTLDELERMSPDELEEALNLKPKTDIPPAARRSMREIGVLAASEGGLPAMSLAAQDATLVRAVLAGNKGQLVSRWGHILLRRALVSRLDAPAGMNPADFAALRAGLLTRMGEGEAARALVQDVDTGNYSPALVDAAFDAYVATADFTGLCPTIAIQGGARDDPQWDAARAICTAFRGEGAAALSQLDRALSRGAMPRVDVLLAQKYAGAAGKARRAVKIEWDGVKDMTPWRYGLALAVGVQPPEGLLRDAGARYDYIAATAPMLGLTARAAAADRAAGVGILSSEAMVDLYSQIYADQDTSGDWSKRATMLRDAYISGDAAARLAAMQGLWNSTANPAQRYSRQVLTAYAAARLPANAALADGAPDLIASMLAAGLDRNALRWASVTEAGSQGWAMLALAAPARSSPVETGLVETFRSDDDSADSRKSAFLLAGLAGLGRLTPDAADSLASSMKVDLKRQTRWSRLIDRAAEVDNPMLVALLAGVGMQGDGWNRMTPRHLYHIVSALRRVGLDAEARMIAAEAVARG